MSVPGELLVIAILLVVLLGATMELIKVAYQIRDSIRSQTEALKYWREQDAPAPPGEIDLRWPHR
jgi:hypothetical protein